MKLEPQPLTPEAREKALDAKSGWNKCVADWKKEKGKKENAMPTYAGCEYCKLQDKNVSSTNQWKKCQTCIMKPSCFKYLKANRQYENKEITAEQLTQIYDECLAMLDEIVRKNAND